MAQLINCENFRVHDTDFNEKQTTVKVKSYPRDPKMSEKFVFEIPPEETTNKKEKIKK